MRSFPSSRFAAFAVVIFWVGLLVAPAANAQEKKPAEAPAENPQFTHWVKFKTGSSVTMSGDMDAGGQKVPMRMKTTLVEVAKDSVTIERVVSMNIGGQERAQPAQKEVVKAATTGEKLKLVGEEEVTVAGKALKCKVYELQKPADQGDRTGPKLWVNEAVPGGAVKMAVQSPGGNITLTVKEYEAK